MEAATTTGKNANPFWVEAREELARIEANLDTIRGLMTDASMARVADEVEGSNAILLIAPDHQFMHQVNGYLSSLITMVNARTANKEEQKPVTSLAEEMEAYREAAALTRDYKKVARKRIADYFNFFNKKRV